MSDTQPLPNRSTAVRAGSEAAEGAAGFRPSRSPTDTIFALSSGRLPAAIAVVRVSGPQAGAVAVALAGKLPPPRRAALRILRDPRTKDAIDQGLVLWFPGPDSETGEDVVEFQVHGGAAVVAALFRSLGALPGTRVAEAGEFTRRALDNDKLDLTRVEALADLVGATTEAQRRQALEQLQGALGRRAETWRERLIAAMALVEAGLDFAEEGDVPDTSGHQARAVVEELRAEIALALDDGGRGERLRDGLVVAIAGPPNAGKSSLLNRLARREAALVSPIPGTTRDVIEVHLDIEGCPVTLLDTAGLRASDDILEQAGMVRARERAAAADLVLWVEDAVETPVSPDFPNGSRLWRIGTKADLLDSGANQNTSDAILVSSLTGSGIDGLWAAIGELAAAFVRSTEPAVITRARHRAALDSAVACLDRALALPASTDEIFAEELRAAAASLGRLLGLVDVEDVLDSIFRDFCIGK